MMRHKGLPGSHLLVAGLALAAAASCAVQGGVGGREGPAPPSSAAMPAARLGLPAPLRPFYDELEEYGDWVLIEPQGWVFRPRVNTVAWRPYQDGHWEASYSFGWVWVSNEPFGWITDHYGFWFHDEFQGWVWKPYGAWAPSWVAWVQVGDYVGWAPLAPEGAPGYDQVPGGVFTFAPASTLAQSSTSMHASFVNEVPDNGSDIRPIDRVASYRGVHWNAGPDLATVLGSANADRLRLDERDGVKPLPLPPRTVSTEAKPVDLPLLQARTRPVLTEGRREFTVARKARGGAAPSRGAPAGKPPASPRPDERYRPVPEPAADSLGTARGDSLRMRRGRRPRKPSPPDPGNG